MKNVIIALALVFSTVSFAQKKKPTRKAPPPVKEVPPVPPPIIERPIIEEDSTKCFVFIDKQEKDGRVYATENLLEYGWNNNLARMIITSYDYDPIAQKEAEEKGYVLAQSQQIQFIEGVFTIKNYVYTFTPDKVDKFKTETFKITFEGKTKKVKQLTNDKNQVFEKGACLEPMPMMSM